MGAVRHLNVVHTAVEARRHEKEGPSLEKKTDKKLSKWLARNTHAERGDRLGQLDQMTSGYVAYVIGKTPRGNGNALYAKPVPGAGPVHELRSTPSMFKAIIYEGPAQLELRPQQN